MSDLKSLYEELHEASVVELLRRIKSGEAKPADLAVARQLLRDNGVTAVPTEGSPLQLLTNHLPFSGDDEESSYPYN
jgi:hypothetical protein